MDLKSVTQVIKEEYSVSKDDEYYRDLCDLQRLLGNEYKIFELNFLWRLFSEKCYSAQFLNVDLNTVDDFIVWLKL